MAITKTRTRRFTACHRHPSEPVTGFCALCLRDRLSGLDSSSSSSSSGQNVQKAVVCSRRTRNQGVPPAAPVPVPVPELRRSKSVAGEKCDLVTDLRRRSCDVRARNSLSDLFVQNDEISVESMNLGFPRIKEPVIEINEDQFEAINDDDDDEIRVSDDVIEINKDQLEAINDDDDDDDEIRVSDDVIEDQEEEEGDLKTMKEYIDIEFELRKNQKNFWEAASVFSQKLRKWRLKQKKNSKSKLGQSQNTHSDVADYGYGRRSCDTEPRFSTDAHRLSVEDPRFSFDEHRASWDGYMIAKTIPRLTPMTSLLINTNINTNTQIENLQMHSISEDGSSSGGSGVSNSAGSSWSSMKSSNSSTKTVGLGGDDMKSASNSRVTPANDAVFHGTKLVITEKELKDWRLNSNNNSNIESVADIPKTPVNERKKVVKNTWKKVCNLWGHKYKLDDKNGDKKNPENVNLVRNPSSVNSSVNSRIKRDEFVLDRSRSTRYSTSDIDSGLLRLYLTPFRNTRRGKSGKNRVPLMPSNGSQFSQK